MEEPEKFSIILVVLVVLVKLEILVILEKCHFQLKPLAYAIPFTNRLETIISDFKNSFDKVYCRPVETVLESR